MELFKQCKNQIITDKISKYLDLYFVLEIVNTVIKLNKNNINGLILHSDQGAHYAYKTYQVLLSKHVITKVCQDELIALIMLV